jgi:hypothetical protein
MNWVCAAQLSHQTDGWFDRWLIPMERRFSATKVVPHIGEALAETLGQTSLSTGSANQGDGGS